MTNFDFLNNSYLFNQENGFLTIAYTYVEPMIDKALEANFWGEEVDKFYQDISTRDNLTQLIVDCQVCPPRYLLVRDLAELGDNWQQVNQVMQTVEKLNINLIAIAQNYNSQKLKSLNHHDQKEILITIGQEIEKTYQKRKLKQAQAHNRLQILPPPGKAPYGYLRGKESYIINRATAPIVKDFFARFLLFGSLTDSVNYLYNKYQKKIALSTARYWLTNPVYRGDLIYQKNQLIANTHAPIISREEAAQIDRILKSHRRFFAHSTTANYCLAGLTQCKICQSSLKINQVKSKNKSQKYLYLVATKCPKNNKCKSVKYHDILEKIINYICEYLPQEIEKLDLSQVNLIPEKITKTLEQKEQILAKLPSLVKQEILDQQTANIRKYHLKKEIAQLQQQIEQLPPPNLITIATNLAIPEFWQDLSEAEKRFYLREFIKKIEIKLPNKQDLSWTLTIDFVFS